MPGGEKVEPLTKEQVQKVAGALNGSTAVIGAVTQAMTPAQGSDGRSPMKSPISGALVSQGEMSEIVSYIDASLVGPVDEAFKNELKNRIKSSCKVTPMQVKTEVKDGTRNGDQVSGTLIVQGQGEMNGSECPTATETSVDGKVNFRGTIDDNTNEAKALSYSGGVQFAHRMSVLADITKKSGFKNLSLRASVNGSGAGSSQAGQANVEARAALSIDTADFGVMTGELLSELDIVGQKGEMSSMNLKLAIVFKAADVTILVQVFSEKTDQGLVTKVYLNGEEQKPSETKP